MGVFIKFTVQTLNAQLWQRFTDQQRVASSKNTDIKLLYTIYGGNIQKPKYSNVLCTNSVDAMTLDVLHNATEWHPDIFVTPDVTLFLWPVFTVWWQHCHLLYQISWEHRHLDAYGYTQIWFTPNILQTKKNQTGWCEWVECCRKWVLRVGWQFVGLVVVCRVRWVRVL